MGFFDIIFIQTPIYQMITSITLPHCLSFVIYPPSVTVRLCPRTVQDQYNMASFLDEEVFKIGTNPLISIPSKND